jgi:hypothetical protein
MTCAVVREVPTGIVGTCASDVFGGGFIWTGEERMLPHKDRSMQLHTEDWEAVSPGTKHTQLQLGGPTLPYQVRSLRHPHFLIHECLECRARNCSR